VFRRQGGVRTLQLRLHESFGPGQTLQRATCLIVGWAVLQLWCMIHESLGRKWPFTGIHLIIIAYQVKKEV